MSDPTEAADRPTQEIEITRAMLDRATEFLWDSGIVAHPANGPDQLLVAGLFRTCFGSSVRIPHIAEADLQDAETLLA